MSHPRSAPLQHRCPSDAAPAYLQPHCTAHSRGNGRGELMCHIPATQPSQRNYLLWRNSHSQIIPQMIFSSPAQEIIMQLQDSPERRMFLFSLDTISNLSTNTRFSWLLLKAGYASPLFCHILYWWRPYTQHLARKWGGSQVGQLHLVSEIREVRWELHSCQS